MAADGGAGDFRSDDFVAERDAVSQAVGIGTIRLYEVSRAAGLLDQPLVDWTASFDAQPLKPGRNPRCYGIDPQSLP